MICVGLRVIGARNAASLLPSRRPPRARRPAPIERTVATPAKGGVRKTVKSRGAQSGDRRMPPITAVVCGALGRLTRHDVTSDEQNTSGSAMFTRTTEYTSYDADGREPDGAQRWTDYCGSAASAEMDLPYGDFAVTIGQQGAAVIDESMRYLNAGDGAGGVVSQQTVVEGQGDELDYLHGDLIRSTVATTDADGQSGVYSGPPITVAYTAFGELVTRDGSGNVTIGSAAPAGFPRYQYAGGWGYESGSADASSTGGMLTLNGAEGTSAIRLMHVGERWYQPDIGRFVLRDPIGWRGGINIYACGVNNPLVTVDPTGRTIGGILHDIADDGYNVAGVGGVLSLACFFVPGGGTVGVAGLIMTGITAATARLIDAVGTILDLFGI
ncbi:MAG: hypothetical protein CHACPFDD_03730 [Phycisphaerae bacterium]|nr:hypothetical protein [Phycisphaerae bacterium]